MIRVSRELSQSAMGRFIGVTFQQLQKYEVGTNRISASKLHDIARVLDIEVRDLFADASDPEKLGVKF
jgi:transcriptional regulator with XRE-family HTH domain